METELFDRLDRSAHLIVLACPEARTSRGMEMETQHWFSKPRTGQILIIVTAGNDTTWPDIRDHLLPLSVRNNLRSEPLWIPLQHRRAEILSNPKDPQLRAALTEDLKQILLRFYPDSDWTQLRGEEKSQRRRLVRLLSAAALLFLILAAAAGTFALYAVRQRDEARAQLSRNDWQFSRNERNAGHLLESLQWAAEAIDVNPKGASRESILLDVRAIWPLASLSTILALSPSAPPSVLPHEMSVSGARFSKDESRILTWSDDKTARLWDARKGIQIGTSLKHGGIVDGAVFSDDESRILTWSEDNTARLWDARTGSQLGPALNHDDAVYGGVFSKDESRILTWSGDRAQLWDARTASQIGLALNHGSRIRGAVFSQDESRILTWGPDSMALLWDAHTSSKIRPALQFDLGIFARFSGSSVGIVELVFSKDGSRILTLGSDSRVRLWESRTGSQIGPAITIDDSPFGKSGGAVLSQDESRILTWGGNDARLWDTRTGTQIGPALEHQDAVTRASFSKDESRILTCSWDNTARLWDTRTGSQIGPALQNDGAVNGAMFGTNGTRILTWSETTVRQWDLPSERQIGPTLEHEGSGAFPTKENSRVLTRSADKTWRVQDASTGSQIGAALKYEGETSGWSFGKDDSRVVTWSKDGTARLWDARTGGQIGSVVKLQREVTAALFSNDGSRILILGKNDPARLLDARTGDEIGTGLKHGDDVSGGTFSKGGGRILTWSPGGTARQWNAHTGTQIGPALQLDISFFGRPGAMFSQDETQVLTWNGRDARLWDARTGSQIGAAFKHEGGVFGALFSQDESRILTWSDDKTARLWDARTGIQIGPALKHKDGVSGALFNQNESRILTWSFDNTARLWDAQTGYQLGPAITSVKGARFTKDETHILTWSDDGTARLWDISADLDFPADQFKTVVQALTGVELDVNSQQLKTIEPARWRTIRDQYHRTASAHALVCKYPTANQWLRFHPVPSPNSK